VSPRTPVEVLDLAVALKKEVPERTAAQVAAILRAHSGWSPDERTLQRHFVRLELSTRPDGSPPQAFGRFEADAPNQRWTGDALHGPTVGGRKAILFAFIGDHSRLLAGYRWARREDTVRLEAALRNGLASRGIRDSIYLDNGAAMIDKQFERACACLGIRLVHSRPGQPAGRGKIERFFRTVREQFLVEIGSGRELDDMTHLNTLFTAWIETVYHRRVHTETGQAPIQRWEQGWSASSDSRGPRMPSTAQLREAFLWSGWRTVTKTATVGLHGNKYEVDAVLVGRKVELVFDPFDLTRIQVRWRGRPMGQAVPHVIGRHVHAKARPDDTTAPEPAPTGIDYLHLVEAQHTAELADRVQYAQLRDEPAPDEPVPDGHVRGQLPLPGTGDDAADAVSDETGEAPA
jgi:putative transposase